MNTIELGSRPAHSAHAWSRSVRPAFQTDPASSSVMIAALSQRTKVVSAKRAAITRHNCSVLLDKGYLPTGAETFAGERANTINTKQIIQIPFDVLLSVVCVLT